MKAIPVELGDLVEIVMGQAPPGAACNKDGLGTVFVKAGEFQERSPEIVEWTTKPLKMSRPDDTLVCVVGATAGKVNFSSFDCAIGRSVAAVRPKVERIIPDFLFQFLRTKVEQLRNRSQGAAQGVITREMLQELRIFLPALSEQRRIAAILDKADALRIKRRAALAQLNNLAESIFVEMFGDPNTNPKKWPVVSIGDLLASASYGTSEKSNTVGKFPVLRMNNITRTGDMDFTDLKYMDLKEAEYDRYLVKAGDVLFNRTNSAELVGKTAIFRQAEPMAYAGYLIRLRTNPDNDPEYLAAFMNSRYTKRVLRGMCKSIIGMANINATEVQSIKIAQPPLALQVQFRERIESLNLVKTTHRAMLAELEGLFSSLQQRGFGGEL